MPGSHWTSNGTPQGPASDAPLGSVVFVGGDRGPQQLGREALDDRLDDLVHQLFIERDFSLGARNLHTGVINLVLVFPGAKNLLGFYLNEPDI